MKVIVDTSVWSLALRHDKHDSTVPIQELRPIIHDRASKLAYTPGDFIGYSQ